MGARAALLLLWVPGCLSLSGPRHVTGTVGGTLSVQCRYQEKYAENKKYWCRNPCFILRRSKIVETTEAEREVRTGRVSIRDDPANLTFTVTLKNLKKDDADTYWCGIDASVFQNFVDPTFEVVVTVSPASSSSVDSIASKTSTIPITTTPIPGVPITPDTVNVTNSLDCSDSTDSPHDSQPSQGLPVLLSLLVLLLLLLAGTSLLAWRMVQRRNKAGENPEPSQNPGEADEQSEPCYANLELQTWSPLEKPVRSEQVEVEYSTVQAPHIEPQYTMVVFNSQNQDSKDYRAPRESTCQPEPEYSEIEKT
ncbi:CMRF35-like molecule 8 [Pteronotus mesoamericanus]|uniref:CMRF35-like molecule 8 n=1 Tax=Pteronotus mesoamericanus TaxID=1884717 RepID=UPI0023ED7248|nr:CMRF35-like molecule 8 [Pteronotus parnellii mesoamericanus]